LGLRATTHHIAINREKSHWALCRGHSAWRNAWHRRQGGSGNCRARYGLRLRATTDRQASACITILAARAAHIGANLRHCVGARRGRRCHFATAIDCLTCSAADVTRLRASPPNAEGRTCQICRCCRLDHRRRNLHGPTAIDRLACPAADIAFLQTDAAHAECCQLLQRCWCRNRCGRYAYWRRCRRDNARRTRGCRGCIWNLNDAWPCCCRGHCSDWRAHIAARFWSWRGCRFGNDRRGRWWRGLSECRLEATKLDALACHTRHPVHNTSNTSAHKGTAFAINKLVARERCRGIFSRISTALRERSLHRKPDDKCRRTDNFTIRHANPH